MTLYNKLSLDVLTDENRDKMLNIIYVSFLYLPCTMKFFERIDR